MRSCAATIPRSPLPSHQAPPIEVCKVHGFRSIRLPQHSSASSPHSVSRGPSACPQGYKSQAMGDGVWNGCSIGGGTGHVWNLDGQRCSLFSRPTRRGGRRGQEGDLPRYTRTLRAESPRSPRSSTTGKPLAIRAAFGLARRFSPDQAPYSGREWLLHASK